MADDTGGDQENSETFGAGCLRSGQKKRTEARRDDLFGFKAIKHSPIRRIRRGLSAKKPGKSAGECRWETFCQLLKYLAIEGLLFVPALVLFVVGMKAIQWFGETGIDLGSSSVLRWSLLYNLQAGSR